LFLVIVGLVNSQLFQITSPACSEKYPNYVGFCGISFCNNSVMVVSMNYYAEFDPNDPSLIRNAALYFSYNSSFRYAYANITFDQTRYTIDNTSTIVMRFYNSANQLSSTLNYTISLNTSGTVDPYSNCLKTNSSGPLVNAKYVPSTAAFNLYACNNGNYTNGTYYTSTQVNQAGFLVTIKVYGSIYADLTVINNGNFIFGYIRADYIYSTIQPSCKTQASQIIQVPDILLVGKSDANGGIFGFTIVSLPQQSSKYGEYVTMGIDPTFTFF